MKDFDYDPETGYPLTGPTELESAWYQEHIVANDYPRIKRDKVMRGQLDINSLTAKGGRIEEAWESGNFEYVPVCLVEPREDGYYVNGEKLITESEEDEEPDWRDSSDWRGEHFTGQD